MTKLSSIRHGHELDAAGRWVFWTGTIYAKVRRFQTPEYQRELRLAHAAIPEPENETPEDRVRRETQIGEKMIPSIARYVLSDWWGVDLETAPVDPKDVGLANEDGWLSVVTNELIAVVDGVELRTITLGEHIFRPLFPFEETEETRGFVQEMERYTPERGIAILSDPRCVDLLNLAKASAHVLDIERIREQVAGLGKLRSTSSGSSSMAKSSKK